jgi:hypothetical protein
MISSNVASARAYRERKAVQLIVSRLIRESWLVHWIDAIDGKQAVAESGR